MSFSHVGFVPVIFKYVELEVVISFLRPAEIVQVASVILAAQNSVLRSSTLDLAFSHPRTPTCSPNVCRRAYRESVFFLEEVSQTGGHLFPR